MSLTAASCCSFGAWFLIANARLLIDDVRYLQRRPGALLVWPGPSPSRTGLMLGLAWLRRLDLRVSSCIFGRPSFGETMMFVYFAYLLPLSRRIGRGFYRDGIWADTAFIRYNEVGGISWREGEHDVSLVVISRLQNFARRLAVPLEHYGAARRLLRDKIGEHEIHFSGTGLGLGRPTTRETRR